MKKSLSNTLTFILLATAFIIGSCSNNDNDSLTDPDFEVISGEIFAYNHTLIFVPGYEDPKTGKAWVDVVLYAKGSNSDCILKINDEVVTINGTYDYTNYRRYDFQGFSADSSQPISYEIIDGTKHLTGTYNLPGILECNFPDFSMVSDYSFTWTIPSDPSLFLCELYLDGEMNSEDYYVGLTEQIDGSLRYKTLNSTMWEGMTYIDFEVYLSAINYMLKDSNKTLVFGIREDHYYWKKQLNQDQDDRIDKIIQAIDKDIKSNR